MPDAFLLRFRSRPVRVTAVLGLFILITLLVFWRHAEIANAAVAGTHQVVERLRAAGPWAFFGAMAVLPAFGFPLLPFTVAAGPAFSSRLGVPGVVACGIAAVAINVALSYGLATCAVEPLVRRILARYRHRLPALPADSDWQAVFLVRLLPGPPFWVQSYLLGLMRVGWFPYIIGSTLVPGLYIAGMVTAGDALWAGRLKPALLALAGLGLVACAIQLVRRAQGRRPSPKSAPPAL